MGAVSSFSLMYPKAETTFHQHHEVEVPLHELPIIFYINVSFSPTKNRVESLGIPVGYPGSLHSGGQLYRQIQDLRSIYLRTLLWSEWCRTTKGTYQGDDSNERNTRKNTAKKTKHPGKKGGLEVEIDRKLWKSCHFVSWHFKAEEVFCCCKVEEILEMPRGALKGKITFTVPSLRQKWWQTVMPLRRQPEPSYRSDHCSHYSTIMIMSIYHSSW